jgi:hypothetical protein
MNPFVRKEIFKAQERQFFENKRHNQSVGNLISIDINNQYFKTSNMQNFSSGGLVTVPSAPKRPGVPGKTGKKEVIHDDPNESSSEDLYVA